ncbi:uncharacterized protein [Oryza sativa Japonica Group]|uniref:uncharacterized protein n=1 Tax=Oryza sativa subsp. japonica TaxID=39947 RepID=UPI00077555DE|nr:uncharacterized protein LOC107278517 [Oryza sativa Japonica Group]XP_052149859.1 uncharacterized protein LOC127768344 isoform X2 [Oryza glaberrima]KAF2937886.1 hypothetical protein DAI22_03g081200 [Oryza sativa Japonica Group]
MKMKRLPLLVLLLFAFLGGGNMLLGIALDARRSTTTSSDHQTYGSIELNGRRLQERRLSSTNRKTRALENVRIDDYRPVDPSPSSKATIGAGPIEHGTPLLPYVPRPKPPPDHPAQSPAT